MGGGPLVAVPRILQHLVSSVYAVAGSSSGGASSDALPVAAELGVGLAITPVDGESGPVSTLSLKALKSCMVGGHV